MFLTGFILCLNIAAIPHSFIKKFHLQQSRHLTSTKNQIKVISINLISEISLPLNLFTTYPQEKSFFHRISDKVDI